MCKRCRGYKIIHDGLGDATFIQFDGDKELYRLDTPTLRMLNKMYQRYKEQKKLDGS